MLARVVDVMREVTDRVVVSVRDPRMARRLTEAAPPGVTWFADRPDLGGAGPGAGMLTALDRLDVGEILFAPGDMPWLSPEALRELIRQAKGKGATSAAPIWPDGWTEPLVQWQRVTPWRGKLGALPTRGRQGTRPTDLLRGGRVVVLFPVALLSDDPRCFSNVNEPGELGGRSVSAQEGTRSLPNVRSVNARRAFWAAASASAREEAAVASRSFQKEALLHARSRIAHLAVHALEDALRCAREAGLATLRLEERLSDVKGTMHAQGASTRVPPG
jgi:molybdopterin-guanine dinucleotide biosynthesis protein A